VGQEWAKQTGIWTEWKMEIGSNRLYKKWKSEGSKNKDKNWKLKKINNENKNTK
jgi:hypothetical protein